MSAAQTDSSSPATSARAQTIDWGNVSDHLPPPTRPYIDGLEPQTVAIAQATFSQLPIGSHGEQLLRDLMWTVKLSVSLYAMLQTSEGAASVALAACLSETFGVALSAKVFVEIAKLMGCPADLSPSFEQWKRYVHECSGIFRDTDLNQKVAELAQNAGFPTRFLLMFRFEQLSLSVRTLVNNPQTLAETIIALGQVQNGQLKRVYAAGGLQGCWAACYADFVLGLRVRATVAVKDKIVLQTYNEAQDCPQVYIQLALTPRMVIAQRIPATADDSTEVFDWRSVDEYSAMLEDGGDYVDLSSEDNDEPADEEESDDDWEYTEHEEWDYAEDNEEDD